MKKKLLNILLNSYSLSTIDHCKQKKRKCINSIENDAFLSFVLSFYFMEKKVLQVQKSKHDDEMSYAVVGCRSWT